ncbi:MAG: YgjV family protein [Clostridiales bacterium]|nr:YgjV family protein [Clostridiales bacterium]
MDLTPMYIVSQLLVIIYYLIYSWTFHLKDSNKILIFGIIATIISSISYLLLNAYTGMAMCFVAIIRNLLFTKSKKSVFNLVLIFILILFASIFTFNNYFSLFNIIATLLYTYALWQKNTKTYKLLGIIVNGLMIIYNIYISSIFGVVLISIAFVNSIVGFIKENKEIKIN